MTNTPTKEITIILNDEDVRICAADMGLPHQLTDIEIGKVLDALKQNHDAELGMSWNTIEDEIISVIEERNSSG